MPQFLYVCGFSNGFVKVGRSSDPSSRIAQHEERVSCLGILLNESHTVECAAHVLSAESALIELCAAAASGRNKNEWFDGLNFDEVCKWAEQCATQLASSAISSIRVIRERLGVTQTALADGMGCTQGNVGHYERGQTIPPDAAKRLIVYAADLGHLVTYEEIYGPAITAQASA